MGEDFAVNVQNSAPTAVKVKYLRAIIDRDPWPTGCKENVAQLRMAAQRTPDTIATVNRRQPSSRWALWVFAVALLLKAAMPLLATASAHAQGKTLVEVCTVYGVALLPLSGQGGEPATGHLARHGAEACALTALVALASAEFPALGIVPAPAGQAAEVQAHAPPPMCDACAAWAARLQHGPPGVA